MRRKLFKTGLSIALVVCMVVGLAFNLPDMVLEVQAATNELDITAYASKAELMSCFDLDGTDDTIGKITFGVGDREWYIVGTDSGVEGDNIILFAANPVFEGQDYDGQDFQEDYGNEKEYTADWGCTYEAEPEMVYPNHYGASDLRTAMLAMTEEDNETYFTAAEKALMNVTEVTTVDTKNETNYTTNDILYALQGSREIVNTIWAGSDDSVAIDIKQLGSDWFWLRTPYIDASSSNNSYYRTDALVTMPSQQVMNRFIDSGAGGIVLVYILPAFNLNLTSVLFASAAQSAISETDVVETISSSDIAMKLRMNGTKKIASKVYISNEAITVYPKDETIALVVQGDDWYYSKQISGTQPVEVTADAIRDARNAAKLPSGPEDDYVLAGKIWIEKTGNDGLIYAKEELLPVDSVDITDITEPVAETTLDTTAVCATTGVKSVSAVSWTPEDISAAYNTSYTATVTLESTEGYEFTEATSATIDGNAATSITLNEDDTLTVTYTYEATQMDVTAAPTADVAAGTYTENQWVTLSTQTEGADIYYTLDGTEPSVTNGSKYTEAISVTGERGQSRTTTIKAVAVKDGMQDSSVVVLEYIINIPNPKLLSITAPTAITGVANGTAKTAQDLGLPERVSIVTEDESVTSAIVTWDLNELANGSYAPLVQTEQTFTVNGTVTLPEGIDANGIELKVQVTVTVDANAESGKDDDGNNDDSGIDDGEDNNDDGQDIIDKPWPFTDIPEMPGYWKYDNVKYVYDRSIMNGIAGTTLFDPDGKLNRAMFATVLYRMAGSPKVEFKNTFTDVEDGKYYSDAVMWVNEKGIAQGFQDGSYGVTRNITREQIAKMLCEYAMKQGYDASGRSSLDSFTDKDSVNYWAVDYMQWTVNTGMISGKPNGDGSFRLDPKGDATRAECAKMLTMFLKKYEPNK